MRLGAVEPTPVFVANEKGQLTRYRRVSFTLYDVPDPTDPNDANLDPTAPATQGIDVLVPEDKVYDTAFLDEAMRSRAKAQPAVQQTARALAVE